MNPLYFYAIGLAIAMMTIEASPISFCIGAVMLMFMSALIKVSSRARNS